VVRQASTGADDFFVQASHKSGQVWRQLVRQLKFHLNLMPNRRLHLATQSQHPLRRIGL
jgi:hypothetical protein